MVEARIRHFRERREKLRNAKFHKPKGEYVFSSFDVIDYGDEDFDPAVPFGEGIFDHILFKPKKDQDEYESPVELNAV